MWRHVVNNGAGWDQPYRGLGVERRMHKMRLWSIRIGVIVSVFYSGLGLHAVLQGDIHRHATFMVPGGLTLFASTIAYSYSALVLRRLGAGVEALGMLLLAMLALFPIFLYIGVSYAWMLYTAPAIVMAIIVGFGALKLGNRVSRASYLSLAFSYAASGILMPLAYQATDVYGVAVLLSLSLLVPMIYAVSFQSYTLTCSLRPTIWLLPASVLASIASSVALLYRINDVSSVLVLSSLLFYAVGARLYAAAKCQRGTRAHQYFALGHYVVLASIAYAFYAVLTSSISVLLHSILIGFIGLHIAVHAPMMVPVAAGIPNARRFTPLPYALLLAAAAAWRYSCIVSLALVVFSLLSIVAIVARKPRLR
ncbi:hypothetical protein Pdsh_09235 [Pyrodictium delaneyi]|uniref:Uncharacterized protein n=1 Tax=Pyrodictium delaneyi TaxID=1273541 RepID=A0A211YLV8_9CREN|nr:hypothetical protein Pdsh_09235 [Pyrodictium delaneyi]